MFGSNVNSLIVLNISVKRMHNTIACLDIEETKVKVLTHLNAE